MAKNSGSTTTDQYDAETGTNSGGGFSDRISGLSGNASQQIDNSPLIALGAGVALGAVLGAVLPASRKERELLAPVGTKLADAGYGAVDRARDMSKQKFDEMAGDKVREFFGMSGGSSSSSSSNS